jgi:hypothetical protein
MQLQGIGEDAAIARRVREVSIIRSINARIAISRRINGIALNVTYLRSSPKTSTIVSNVGKENSAALSSAGLTRSEIISKKVISL